MHNNAYGMKMSSGTSANLKKSESNERLNDVKNKKMSSLHKSNSCEQLMRKSSSFDNIKGNLNKVKPVRSANSIYDVELLQSKLKMTYIDDELQGFKVDEHTEQFLDELCYVVVDENNISEDKSINYPHEDNEEDAEKDDCNDANNVSKSMDMIKHLAATNCPGIIYDCIQKKDEIIHDPGSFMHIVQDHVTSHAIHSLSDHIFHM